MSIRKVINSVLYFGLALLLAVGWWGSAPISSVQAQTIWTVCPSGCDFTTIQAAVDSTSVADGDVINVSHPEGSPHTEAGISVNKSVTINGQGRLITIVQAAASPGIATNRVFLIPSTKTVTIQNMTIRYGNIGTQNGGGIRVDGTLLLNDAIVSENISSGRGGGIYVHTDSAATLTNVIIRENSATGVGGGGIDSVNRAVVTIDASTVYSNTAQSGGGIRNYADAVMVIKDSVINGNEATTSGGGGGGLYNQSATMTVINSTISNNTATAGVGGGIYNLYSGAYFATISLTNVSVISNTALSSGSGIQASVLFSGGSSSVSIGNTIVFGNTCADVPSAGAVISSNGYNLFGTSSGCPTGGTGDIFSADAKLGPLALNGGKTKSQALLDLSPAIDNGYCPTLTSDQRSKARPVDLDDLTYPNASGGDACDIGAFERQAADLTGQVNTWTLNTPTPIASTGITVTVTSGDPGTVTVLNRDEFPGGGFSSGELQVVWTITASSAPFTADLEFCVPDDITGMTLSAWRWNEATFAWEDQGGTHTGQCVAVTGVTDFSPWTVAANTPTAITLTDFTAQSARTTLAVSVGIVLVAGVLFFLFSRKRTSDF